MPAGNLLVSHGLYCRTLTSREYRPMKNFWWKSAIVAAFVSALSHVAVMAVAQTVSAPYPPLLPPTIADKLTIAPYPGATVGNVPTSAQPLSSRAADTGKGSTAGASRGDFKPVGRTAAQGAGRTIHPRRSGNSRRLNCVGNGQCRRRQFRFRSILDQLTARPARRLAEYATLPERRPAHRFVTE